MKIPFIIYFTILVAWGSCGYTAQEGSSIQKILPIARKDNSALPARPQSPALSPAEKSAQTIPPYNPTGKPDPFSPTTISLETKSKGKNKGLPLEQFEVSDFELVGVVTGSGVKKAMVQDLTGKGFFIQVGTSIGRMGGKVIRITEKEVVIEEPFQDFLGRRSSRVITLRLPQAQQRVP